MSQEMYDTCGRQMLALGRWRRHRGIPSAAGSMDWRSGCGRRKNLPTRGH